jgi:crossover junction endodeoxyribonuclease RuvC
MTAHPGKYLSAPRTKFDMLPRRLAGAGRITRCGAAKKGHDARMRTTSATDERPLGLSVSAPVVLGLDPGLQRTGYAFVSAPAQGEPRLCEAGVIRLQRSATLPARLVELEASVLSLMERHRPTALACEELYAHYKHPRTAILMGHARGVLLLLGARLEMEIVSVAATNVKKLLTGHGHARKHQMQAAVAATLRLPSLPEPHDVADAIAIALCGVRLRQAGCALRTRGAEPRA